MSGAYTGVQKRILLQQPKATYVHCAAHNLNLVLNDAMSGVKEIAAFFVTLQDLYCFFRNGISRWDLLSSFTGESTVTLKKLNPTRWARRVLSVTGIKVRFQDVMKALSRILLESKKKDGREEASRVEKNIENFEFVILLVVVSKILSDIDIASKYLQRKDVDLLKATEQLQLVLNVMVKYRQDFTKVRDEAVTICKQWGLLTNFADKHVIKRKRHFDELAEDSRLAGPEDCFRISVFNAVLDIVISQMQNRFQGMTNITEKFSILQPNTQYTVSEKVLLESATKLKDDYSDDLSDAFPLQLVTFRAVTKQAITSVSFNC